MPGPKRSSPDELALKRRIKQGKPATGINLPPLVPTPPPQFDTALRKEWQRVVTLLDGIATEGDRALVAQLVRLSVAGEQAMLSAAALGQLRALSVDLGLTPRHERTPREAADASPWDQF